MKYKIKAIKFCEQLCPGPEIYHLSHWDKWLKVYFYFWIVRNGEKVILVDTGIRDVNEVNPAMIATWGEKGKFVMSDEEEIPKLLHTQGIRPEDVDYVFITHLHYDHCSNIPLFNKAKIIISKKGWINTLAPKHPYLVPPGFFPRDIFAYLIEKAGERLYLAEDREEVLPGIEVFWIGGHTMCSQAVKIDTAKGKVILTGDTVFLYGNIEKDIPIGLSYNIIECLDAMKQIKNEADIIIPGHDPEILERYPQGEIA